VEIYRVFPNDSTIPPSGRVPTRANSPADNAFAEASSADGTLRFTATVINPSFEATNSVNDGIHPSPDQTTGGEGPVAGQEVRAGNFLWLSAPGPVPPLFTNDLQMWIRNADLDPDWLRVGGDIVGPTPASGPRFNGSFSLSGTTP